MALSERIVFLPYTRGKRGAITPGVPVPCRNAAEGERRAEKAIASGSAIGGHVVQVMADEAAGDYGEPVFLAAFGVVPEPV